MALRRPDSFWLHDRPPRSVYLDDIAKDDVWSVIVLLLRFDVNEECNPFEAVTRLGGQQ